MSDNANQLSRSDNYQPSNTQRRLLGLPDKADEKNDKLDVAGGKNNLIELALAPFAPPPGGPNFSKAATEDADAKQGWDNLNRDFNNLGYFADFRESVYESSKIRLKAINERPAPTGKEVDRIRENLRALRREEGKAGANDYLTPEMRIYDRALIIAGEKKANLPATLQKYKPEYLATLEVQRMAGRAPDSRTDERNVMQTLISENLREYFPFERPWTNTQPWSDIDKEIAANRMQLCGTRAQKLADVERYHNRFLAATIFAEIRETGRPYGVQTNRVTLNQFILDHVGDDLRVTGGGTWDDAAKRAFCQKYETNPQEAEEMRERVLNVQAGNVI